MQDRGFNGFESNIIKRQVNKTKLSCLLARTRAIILYISISIFDFGPEKLPGILRNGPQNTTATLGRAPSRLRRLLRLWPSSKRRGCVGRKSLAFQLGWKRRHKTNSVTHFQPCARNTWKHLQKHLAVVPHSSKYSGRSNHWHYIDYQNKQQSKKTKADPVPRESIFLLFCCEGRFRRGGDGKTATGSFNTGKFAGGQGRRHLPNRFHPRFFGRARPKSACRAFAQLDRFCFPGFWVPRGERHYSGQHCERWWARLHLDTDDRQRVYDKDKAIQQKSLAVRSGRSPETFWGTLADYVCYKEKHLRKTLAHLKA